MNLTTKIGSLAVIGLFSVTTLAQVAVRPRPTEVRPETEVRPNVTPQGQAVQGTFGRMQTTAPAKSAEGASCNRADAINKLVADTGLNRGIVETGMNKLVIVGCKAGEQGLLSFESKEAKKVAVLTGYYMAQNNLTGPAALAKAKEEVGGKATTAEAEAAAFQQLTAGNGSACQVFKAN